MKLDNTQFLIVVGAILAVMLCVVCVNRYARCLEYGGRYCVFKG